MQIENLKALMYETQYKGYSPDLLMYETLLEKDIPVVEFGSGTGRITEHLLKCGYTVYGIEKEKSYSDYFSKKIKGKLYESKFILIDKIEESNEVCNIIYPFNVFFYMKEKKVIEELMNLKTLKWNKVVIETDNIHSISDENLTSKTHYHHSFSFKEIIIRNNLGITVQNEVAYDFKTVLKFDYSLYLHKAKFLLSLFENMFESNHIYGDFDLNPYDTHCHKLIAVFT